MVQTKRLNAARRYDGSIRSAGWQTPGNGMRMFAYQYNTKSQLSDARYGGLSGTAATGYTYTADEGERYSENNLLYDPNGNITSIRRTEGRGLTSMNDRLYYYTNSNKLEKTVSQANNVVTENFSYNQIGEMTGQESALTTDKQYLDYDYTGQVRAIYRDAGHNQLLARYTLNEKGKRVIAEEYYDAQNPDLYRTTYYVPDGSGKVLATYYFDASRNSNVLYEHTLYGTSRIGVLRRARDTQPADQLYELHDNLGSTRVVFHRPVTATYTATMESYPPQVKAQEERDFSFPTGYEVRSSTYARGGSINSARLGSRRLQGPTKKIIIERGDKIHLEVYAAYPNSSGIVNVRGMKPVIGLAAASTIGQPGPARVGQEPDQDKKGSARQGSGIRSVLNKLTLGVAFPIASKTMAPTAVQSLPNAVFQYVLRDKDDTYLSNGTRYVTANSEGRWDLLSFDVTAEQAGSIEVTLSSIDGVPVYFDDLKIEHSTGPIVEENNYYAYGLQADGLSWRRQDATAYGFGFQGQYARADKAVGYNNFDLRTYSSRLGRWLSKDPFKQYYSPYTGVGNNPANRIDPNGGFDSKVGAYIHKKLFGGSDAGDIYKSGDQWLYARNLGDNNWVHQNNWNAAPKFWNSSLFRSLYVHDKYFFTVGGNFVQGSGVGGSLSVVMFTRGPQAFHPFLAATGSARFGAEMGVGVSAGSGNYFDSEGLGNVEDINMGQVAGRGADLSVSATLFSGNVAVGLRDDNTPSFIDAAVAPGAKVGASVGISNTWILDPLTYKMQEIDFISRPFYQITFLNTFFET